MRAILNMGCIGCGTCVGICPVVFQIGDDGTAEIVKNVDAHHDEVQAAIEACPMSVIEFDYDKE